MSGDIPELSFSIDLRGIRAWTETEDGQPVLHVADDSQHVTFESVAGDEAIDARAGVACLGGAVTEMARLLDTGGEVDWWTPPEVVDIRHLPPANAHGF